MEDAATRDLGTVPVDRYAHDHRSSSLTKSAAVGRVLEIGPCRAELALALAGAISHVAVTRRAPSPRRYWIGERLRCVNRPDAGFIDTPGHFAYARKHGNGIYRAAWPNRPSGLMTPTIAKAG